MKVIAASWQEYVAKVLPAGVGPDSVQYQETRQAFYAGATVMLAEQLKLMQDDHAPTPADVKVMEGIAEELREFVDVLTKERETQ